MKTLNVVFLSAAMFFTACGEVKTNSTPAQDQTKPIQTNPIQTNPKLSTQGLVWNVTAVDPSGYGGGEVSMVLDTAGRPVISYSSAQGELKLVHCGDATCSGGNGSVQTVDLRVESNRAMVLDANGHPVIAYTALVNNPTFPTGSPYLRLVHCGNANCSGGNIFQTLDDDRPTPDAVSLVLDTAGKPVISYEISGYRFHVQRCGDVNCSTKTPSIWSYDPQGDNSMVLDARGNAVIGFSDKGAGLLLIRCGDAACATTFGDIYIERDPIVVRHPSLVLDSSDRPVMSYYDETNQDLKLLQCGNVTCADQNRTMVGVKTVVASVGNVGNWPSMKLAAGDKPVIAHADATNGTLKLVQCGNTSCTSDNVSQVVDFAGAGYATRPALALDANGNPVIAYGNSSGQLRLARLIDNGITPPTITPTITGTLGNNGWYTSDFTLSWTINDNGSPVITSSGCTPTTYTSDSAGGATCSATNAGGTTKQFVSTKRDATKPILNPTVSPNPVLRYLSATATPNAEDNLSGVASQNCATPNTGTAGFFSVICTATDNAGNTATVAASYTVISASQGLQNLTAQINALPINPRIKSGLLGIVGAAQRTITVSKQGTLNLLNAFINLVKAQTNLPFGLGIGASNASALISAATLLRASITAGP